MDNKKLIYQTAKRGINFFMLLLGKKLGFNNQETSWDIEDADDKKVIFVFHRRIQELIKKQYELDTTNTDHKMCFPDSKTDECKIIVTAGGIESYFLLALLEESISRLVENTCAQNASNRAELLAAIEKITAASAGNLGISNKFTIEINYRLETRKYQVSISSNNLKWKCFRFEDTDHKKLIARIEKKLPGKIRGEISKEN